MGFELWQIGSRMNLMGEGHFLMLDLFLEKKERLVGVGTSRFKGGTPT
jgi:hypothetical protein